MLNINQDLYIIVRLYLYQIPFLNFIILVTFCLMEESLLKIIKCELNYYFFITNLTIRNFNEF